MPNRAFRPQPGELAALRGLAAAPGTPPQVARRARIVLAATGEGPQQAAAPTVRRWVRRFVEDGPEGLADRPRSGRPAADGTDDPLLVAPLLLPTAGWTSRSLAELTGRSQAAVARAWGRAYPQDGSPAAAGLPVTGLRLEAAAAGPGSSVLVLSGGPAAHAPSPAPPRGPSVAPASGPVMRSPRRPALQTLLAADLLAAGRTPVDERGAAADDVALVARIRRRLPAATGVHVLTRRPLPGLRPVLGPGEVTQVVVPSAQAWQALLADLVRRCTRSPAAELVTAQTQAMEWARSERPRFEWTARSVERPAGPPPGPRRPTAPRASSQALVDEVLAAVLRMLEAGRLAGGDRVTESFLAREMHASRGHVRDALLTLASHGLLELEPHRGAVVPVPQTADVIETYAARRTLGTLVARRACHWTPGSLAPAEQAFEQLLRTGATGDSRATGEADLRFQDALAASTRMRRIPGMLFQLTDQVRLFLAVLGLDYTYSVTGMCQDDTTLMEHIRARDETGAVRAWNRKIDDATAYMTTQLAIASGRPVSRPGAG